MPEDALKTEYSDIEDATLYEEGTAMVLHASANQKRRLLTALEEQKQVNRNQQERIESLEAQVEEKSAQVAALEVKNASLEARVAELQHRIELLAVAQPQTINYNIFNGENGQVVGTIQEQKIKPTYAYE